MNNEEKQFKLHEIEQILSHMKRISAFLHFETSILDRKKNSSGKNALAWIDITNPNNQQ